MSQAATRLYRGASPEQRLAERRRRLMDAALDIIGTQGWSATTLRGVCEQAKVGPRFFYESFPDLDSLAAAVLDEAIEGALGAALEAITAAPEDLPAKARAGVSAYIHHLTDDPRLARLVFSEAHGSETMTEKRFALVERIGEATLAQANALLPVPPGTEAASRAVSILVAGGVSELILVWLRGGLDLSRDQLVEVCVQVLLTLAGAAPATFLQLRPAAP